MCAPSVLYDKTNPDKTNWRCSNEWMLDTDEETTIYHFVWSLCERTLLSVLLHSLVLSCWHPHAVAGAWKRKASGWQMLIIKLREGLAESVWQAHLNLEAVTPPPLKWNAYPDVDFQSLRSPPQSASENPTQSQFFWGLKISPRFIVPFRYLMILFTGIQWWVYSWIWWILHDIADCIQNVYSQDVAWPLVFFSAVQPAD